MINFIDKAFLRYGNTVSLEQDGKKYSYKAFMQPLRRCHKLYLSDRYYIPAVFFDNRCLLYIGPRNIHLNSNLRLSCKGIYYTVIATSVYTYHGEDLYVWAILKQEEVNNERNTFSR